LKERGWRKKDVDHILKDMRCCEDTWPQSFSLNNAHVWQWFICKYTFRTQLCYRSSNHTVFYLIVESFCLAIIDSIF